MLFNNREIATFIWILIITLIVLIHPKFKSTGMQVVKSFFHWKIISVIILINLYIFLIIILLKQFNLWDYTFLKDTLYFSLFTSTVILIRTSTSNEPHKILLELLFDVIKFTIFFEFIFNYSTNSLLFEILIIPIIVFLTAIVSVSEKKNKKIHIIFNLILFSLQIYLLIISILRFINQINNLNIQTTTQQFLLTPILTIVLIPMLIIITNIMIFEKINIRLNIKNNISNKDKILLNIKLLLLSKLNIRKLNKYGHSVTYHPMWIDDKYQIREMEIFHMNQETKFIKKQFKPLTNRKIIFEALIWGLFLGLFSMMTMTNEHFKTLISQEQIMLISYILLLTIIVLVTFNKSIFQIIKVFMFSSILWLFCLSLIIIYSILFNNNNIKNIFEYSLYYYGLTLGLTTITAFLQYKITQIKYYKYYANSIEIYYSSDHLHHINNTIINAVQNLKNILKEDFLIVNHVYFKEDIALNEEEIKIKIYGKTIKQLKYNEEEIYTKLSDDLRYIVNKYRAYFTK